MRHAILLVVLASGCGFRVDKVTPERPGSTRAAAPIPVTARYRAAEAETEIRNETRLLYPGRVSLSQDSFKKAIDETGVFERASEGAAAEPGEVFLRLDGTVVAAPHRNCTIGWVLLSGFIAPLMPVILPLYLELSPAVEVEWRLECRGGENELLASYAAATTVAVSGQGFWNGDPAGLLKECVARGQEEAQRVLLGRLAADARAKNLMAALAVANAGRPRAPVAPVEPAAPAPAPPAAPARAHAPGDTFVLVVGVNEYQDARIPKLNFAEQDARSIYGFFAGDKKSPTEQDRVKLLLGKEATRSRILASIREHLEKNAAKADDMVVLYFAGHGFGDATTTYLAGRDADLDALPETAISAATLRDYWDRIRARHRVLVTDACRSGGLAGLRGIGGVALAPRTESTEACSLAIFASGKDELSAEDSRAGQGVFTLALLRGLRGEADADQDKKVTGEELVAFLEREVPALAARAGGRQTPAHDATPAGLRFFLTK